MTYLDNAATSLVKPAAVRKAAADALRTCGGAGRSGHTASARAEEEIFRCRQLAAALFHAAEPESVVFTMNATHALNIAIHSVLTNLMRDGRKQCRVLTSGYEHNAVLRPLYAMRERGVETVPVPSPLFEPEVFLHKLEREMERGADAVVCTHVSNVFGYILPMERIDALCSRCGIPLIVDASQSAGCLPIDAGALRAARYLCMPGHKGLLGPQGTGILLCCGGEDTEPLLYGGTGSESVHPAMPAFLPDRLEAGTLNAHGIAGLAEGIRFVLKKGTPEILEHERAVAGRVIGGLESTPAVRLHTAERMFCQTGVLSLSLREGNCEEAAQYLADRGVCVRAGLHCAPLAHRSAGTLRGGTLRVSPSAFSRLRDADRFVGALKGFLRAATR